MIVKLPSIVCYEHVRNPISIYNVPLNEPSCFLFHDLT